MKIIIDFCSKWQRPFTKGKIASVKELRFDWSINSCKPYLMWISETEMFTNGKRRSIPSGKNGKCGVP